MKERQEAPNMSLPTIAELLVGCGVACADRGAEDASSWLHLFPRIEVGRIWASVPDVVWPQASGVFPPASRTAFIYKHRVCTQETTYGERLSTKHPERGTSLEVISLQPTRAPSGRLVA